MFEEFFIQGDLEKQFGLPVSFLCDRDKTFVVQNQPGFLNFIVIPLFKSLTQVLPECEKYLQGGLANVDNWKNYTETDEDKKIY